MRAVLFFPFQLVFGLLLLLAAITFVAGSLILNRRPEMDVSISLFYYAAAEYFRLSGHDERSNTFAERSRGWFDDAINRYPNSFPAELVRDRQREAYFNKQAERTL